jgi:acetyltransferase-like isoleucine patch superfamily enzyme
MKKEEILQLVKNIREDEKLKKEFLSLLVETLDLRENRFHPLVFINGNPKIGKNVYIGLFSEVNAKGTEVTIGDNCDIASFVSINVADSHKSCLNISDKIERKPIIIECNVFIGSHSVVKGGAHIGHHSVVGAGTIVEGVKIPPYSLVIGNPMRIKEGYYKTRLAKGKK